MSEEEEIEDEEEEEEDEDDEEACGEGISGCDCPECRPDLYEEVDEYFVLWCPHDQKFWEYDFDEAGFEDMDRENRHLGCPTCTRDHADPSNEHDATDVTKRYEDLMAEEWLKKVLVG
jgi:hypothetical protein